MRYIIVALLVLVAVSCSCDYEIAIEDLTYQGKKDRTPIKQVLEQGTYEWFENNLTLKDYQLEFLSSVAVPATVQDLGHHIPLEVTIAQGILESGWGRSRLSKEANNYFGVKDRKNGVEFTTTEYRRGKYVKETAKFAAYSDIYDCMSSRAHWFYNNRRYKNVFKKDLEWKEFTVILQKKGYATDPNYAKKLQRVIKMYKLDHYGEWIRRDLSF